MSDVHSKERSSAPNNRAPRDRYRLGEGAINPQDVSISTPPQEGDRGPAKKILFVSWTDLKGQRFSGYEFLGREIEGWRFSMSVALRESHDQRVSSLLPGKPALSRKVGWKIDRALGLDGQLGSAGRGLRQRDEFREADLVHFHLLHIGPFFSTSSLPRLSSLKPCVWTIHDMWPITGMCVHPFECEAWKTGCRRLCPHPRGHSLLRRLTPSLLWQLKKTAYGRSRLQLVAASRWMKDRLAASPMLQEFPCEVIPFGIDLLTFRPARRAAARAALGIALEDIVLCCRGVRIAEDAFKGTSLLIQALSECVPPQRTHLIVLGASGDFLPLSARYILHEKGWIDDPAELANTLSCADLFLMPSLQESFGLMAVEAMACGAVPVVLPGTALPETTGAPSAGVSADSADANAYAALVRSLLSSPGEIRARSTACVARASGTYGIEAHVSHQLDLYRSMLAPR